MRIPAYHSKEEEKLNRMFKRGCTLALAAIMTTGVLLTGCGAQKTAETTTTQATVALEIVEGTPVLEAKAVTLQESGWQADRNFPDWAGYVDDTLAMNSMYSFISYEGQGKIYITPAEGVTNFSIFINNQKLNPSELTAGKTWELDISDYTVNGMNSIQISNIEPADIEKAVNVKIPYPVVLEGTPEQVGMDPEVLELIDSIVSSDVEHGFTSAQMAIVKDGRLIYENAWGKVNSYLPDGTPNADSPEVTNETLYDLASNTKMYTVNYALQYLVSQKLIDLDTKIVDVLGMEFAENTIYIEYKDYDPVGLEQEKEWKRNLTIRDLLCHQAGFPAGPQYHNDAFDQTIQKPAKGVENVLYAGAEGTEETRQATLKQIFRTPLMYEPGSKTLYSDVDYMLLSFIIEKVTEKDFSTFLKEIFWEPLQLDHITFRPMDNGFKKEDCAATELNGNTRDGIIDFTGVRKDTIQGEVHDEKCYYAMGGISGHAGLFANAKDLAKLASVMLSGGYGDHAFFNANVMDTFTAPKNEDAPHWGLGWWREAGMKRPWYFGTQSSRDTIGHQGWTGTLTLIDPDENLVMVYLTNKINSPVTDPEADRNKFDGNWYTSSTLGFASQLLYMGLEDRYADSQDALTALLADMVNDKIRLVNKQVEKQEAPLTDEHPVVHSLYALVEVLFDRVEATQSGWELAENALSSLDAERDATEIAALEARLPAEDKAA